MSITKRALGGNPLIIAAGAMSDPIEAMGRYIVLLKNSNTEDVQISVDNQAPEIMPVGLAIELPDKEDGTFNRIAFFNNSSAEMTIDFHFSMYRLYYSRIATDFYTAIQSDIRNTGSVEFYFPYYEIPKVMYKRTVTITNIGTNTLWIGQPVLLSSPAPAALGTPILPQQTCVITNSGALYINSDAIAGETYAECPFVLTIEHSQGDTEIPIPPT